MGHHLLGLAKVAESQRSSFRMKEGSSPRYWPSVDSQILLGNGYRSESIMQSESIMPRLTKRVHAVGGLGSAADGSPTAAVMSGDPTART